MKNIFLTDTNLRNKFLAGDDKAYIAMYHLYAKELYAYGLALNFNTEQIEDSIQDIFTYIYANRQRLTNVNNLKVYFFTAFRNKLLDYKKKTPNNQLIEEDIYTPQLEERNYQESWIEREEEETENQQLLERLLVELNTNQREVLYHRFVEGMSYEEIACVMNMTMQSAKNLVHRTIKRLKAFV